MCPPWAAPPAADSCLDYADCATAKRGGTVVRPEVGSIEEHDRWIDEGLYGPEACRCGGPVHAHGTRTRTLKGALGALGEMVPALVILIAVFRCSECGGIWRVLPGFVPRWLHSPWSVVRDVATASANRVSARTRRRWRARLGQDGRKPAQVLATSGAPRLRALVAKLHPSPSRGALVSAFAILCPAAVAFASLAELLHRMLPGIRLM